MKIIEIVKINRELLKNLHTAGVRIEDAEYIDLFSDYHKLLDRGEKVSYIVALLSDRYFSSVIMTVFVKSNPLLPIVL